MPDVKSLERLIRKPFKLGLGLFEAGGPALLIFLERIKQLPCDSILLVLGQFLGQFLKGLSEELRHVTQDSIATTSLSARR